ncbi:MAG: toluene hydroxylase [Actinomycetes bacterium]
MTTNNTRRPMKTWSLLGDVRKKPSTYEVVTAKFHYHFRRDPAPFELDPEVPLNLWYLKNREGSPLMVEDWEGFRDPARLTYRDYVLLQDKHEIYVDQLIDQHEAAGSAGALSSGWVATLRDVLVPLRFPLHVLQMVSIYVGQMAPSSFITNCANFQSADELRRIQRIAYWTKVLANAHGDDLADTETARGPWVNGEAWQPLRELLENLLIAYDWGEAFVALNLAVKPAIDELVNTQLADLARLNGDEFVSNLLVALRGDSERSSDWTSALVSYTVAQDPAMQPIIDGWAAEWRPRAIAACAPIAALFEAAPVPMAADDVMEAVASAVDRAGSPVG